MFFSNIHCQNSIRIVDSPWKFFLYKRILLEYLMPILKKMKCLRNENVLTEISEKICKMHLCHFPGKQLIVQS